MADFRYYALKAADFRQTNKETPMDIRIENIHEQALRNLAKAYGQPTGASMIRLLIHNAAKEMGVWPSPSTAETVSQTTEPDLQVTR